MKTSLDTRYRALKTLACFVISVLLFPSSLSAQHTVDKWMFSTQVGANLWLNDFDQRLVGFGGSLAFGYNPSRVVSVGVEIEIARLKTKQASPTPGLPFDYLALKSRSVSLFFMLRFLPGRALSPYLVAGIGVMKYTRVDGLGGYVPDAGVQSSLRIPLGIGVESFFRRGISIDARLLYTFLDDQLDLVQRGSGDGAFDARLGLNFYIGSSDDEDDDEDGLTNAMEVKLGTNPTNPDTDEDGLSDGAEVLRYKTDPLNADTDGDGLKDGDEVFKYFTDPLNPDTDGDGFSDYEEILKGTDPLNPQSHPH